MSTRPAFARRLRSALSVATVATILLPGSTLAQEVTIRGRVRNAEGKVIRQASVTVRDAEGAKVSTVPQYEDNGETFVVTVPARLGKVSVLFEDRPFHHPHLVTNLSTTPGDDHTINPVLRKASGPAGYDLIVEQIQIYEQILFSQAGAKPSRQTVLDFKKEYGALIGQLPNPAKFKTYAVNSDQHEALKDMPPSKLVLLEFKLRRLEDNIAEVLEQADKLAAADKLATAKKVAGKPKEKAAEKTERETDRYKYYNGRWWYWTAEGWLVWQNGRWVKYSATPRP
jgi:hypothetical protein